MFELKTKQNKEPVRNGKMFSPVPACGGLGSGGPGSLQSVVTKAKSRSLPDEDVNRAAEA